MGNYISSDKLSERIGSSRLAALCGSAESPAALVSSVIERAESAIDSFAALRYSLPLSPCGIVEEWALCLAEYELYKRGPWDETPAKIKDSYLFVMEQLKSLSTGELELPDDKAKKPCERSGSSIAVSCSRSSVFASGGPEGF